MHNRRQWTSLIRINVVRFDGFVIDVVCTRRPLIEACDSIDMKRIKDIVKTPAPVTGAILSVDDRAAVSKALRDNAALKAAVRKGKVTVYQES